MGEAKIVIYNGAKSVTLPVLPEKYDIVDNWDNHELNINKLGLITMIGKRGLRSLTISSFLPNQLYDFVTPGGTTMGTEGGSLTDLQRVLDLQKKGIYADPWAVIKTLKSWRGSVLTFSISGTSGQCSWPCVIDGDFTYGEEPGSGDVQYTITLKEYKKTNTKRTVKKPSTVIRGGGKEIDTTKTGGLDSPTIHYKTKKGDTINKISKKFYGNTKQKKNIYKTNKRAITKAFKKYMKKLSAAEKKKYKKKSKYNKPLPKGTILVLK